MTKRYKHAKEPEIYYYYNSSGEKLWMFRHKYYDSSGKRREKKKSGFKTDKAAIKALMEVKALTLQGNTKQLDYDNMTVSKWLDIWYESNYIKWAPTTQEIRKNAIENRLKPMIGNYKLHKLDRATYQREFINKLVEKFKPNSIKTWHSIFRIAINAAVDEEILPRNRFIKVSIPDEEEVINDNYLTEKELNILLDYAKEHATITNYTALLVLSYTGMRKGELMGLHWKNIDFDNNTITIEHTRDRNGTRKPKTNNSYRTILLDPFVMEQLKKYKAWCKQVQFKHGIKLKDDQLVFISEDGAIPISEVRLNKALKKITKKTGINTITIHGLRHTHATILLNRNANVKAIAERLGNSVDMINRIYGHLTKDSSAALINIFSESLNVSGAKSGANE